MDEVHRAFRALLRAWSHRVCSVCGAHDPDTHAAWITGYMESNWQAAGRPSYAEQPGLYATGRLCADCVEHGSSRERLVRVEAV